MAEGKTTFIVHCDLIHTVEKLSDIDAGQLFKHMLRYTNDLNPATDNIIVDLVFEPIKQTLKRELKVWEETCKRNKINGLKGGRPKNPKEPKKPTGLIKNPPEPKKPDSDSDSDSDSDTIYNKFNYWLKENTPEVAKMKYQLTEKQLDDLLKKHGAEKLKEYLKRMNNWKPLTKQNTSVNDTLSNWIFRDIKKEKETRI